jgi:hypothetical protein
MRPSSVYCSVQLLLDKPVDQLRNTFSNLALPLFTSAEPDPPKATKAKTNGKEWTWTAVSAVLLGVIAVTACGFSVLYGEQLLCWDGYLEKRLPRPANVQRALL